MSDHNKLASSISDIRYYDLYKLASSSSDENTTPVDDFISPGDRVSLQDSSTSEGDPHLRSKYMMKRFLGKKYSNLPVLKEEDGGLSKSPESSGASAFSKYLGDSAVSPGPSGVSKYLDLGVSDEFPTKEIVDDDDVDSSVDEDDIDDMYIFDDQTSGCTDESWVDLSKQTSQPSGNSSPFTKVYSSPQGAMSYGSSTPERVTPPPFGNGEEYLRLLREAQKESNQSSARVSLASSRRDTPRDSPKSPPNSPNTEAVLDNDEEPSPLKGVYINYYNREGDFVRVENNVETDWIWDWSSRPDQTPPKHWKFVHPHKGTVPSRRGASIRRLMVGNSSLFSRDVLYTLFITNVLSLILGTGIGMWLSRKSGGGGNGSNVPLAIVPIN